jgi:hypothetical protein
MQCARPGSPPPEPPEHRASAAHGRAAAACLSALLWLAGCSLDNTGTGGEIVPPDDALGQPAGERRDASADNSKADGGKLDARTPAVDGRVPPVDATAADATAVVVPPPPDAEVTSTDAQVIRDARVADARVVDAAPDPAVDAGPMCDLAGSFGVRMDMDVKWGPVVLAGFVPVLQPGRGNMRVYLTAHTDAATGGRLVEPCGLEVPDFQGTQAFGNELYGGDIPKAAWDARTMPSWNSRWTAACNYPGCAYDSDAMDVVLGARFTGTGSVLWPAPGGWGASGMFEGVDDDSDGKPGITMITRGPNETSPGGRLYSYPPVGFADFGRARTLQLAAQLRMKFGGMLQSCDQISGTVPAAEVHISAVGCTGVLSGETMEEPCAPEVTQFVDSNLPVWTVQSATFQMVRLPMGAGCYTTRAVLAP